MAPHEHHVSDAPVETPQLETAPVLLLAFNRPRQTREVLLRIRDAAPAFLFVAMDGPRSEDEADLCRLVRREVEELVDWGCTLRTLYRDRNLGCGRAVSEAIHWFFGEVASGIVLEDDCLPDESFFPFCTKLLIRYATCPEVMMITGLNPLEKWRDGEQSYGFSFLGGIWGWASWRRAWELCDLEMKDWPRLRDGGDLVAYFASPEQYHVRERLYQETYEKRVDTWDMQWSFSRIANGGLSIVPSVNLIRNIGLGGGSTHTHAPEHPLAQAALCRLRFPLVHPPAIANDEDYARAFYDRFEAEPPSPPKRKRRFLSRLRWRRKR